MALEREETKAAGGGPSWTPARIGRWNMRKEEEVEGAIKRYLLPSVVDDEYKELFEERGELLRARVAGTSEQFAPPVPRTSSCVGRTQKDKSNDLEAYHQHEDRARVVTPNGSVEQDRDGTQRWGPSNAQPFKREKKDSGTPLPWTMRGVLGRRKVEDQKVISMPVPTSITEAQDTIDGGGMSAGDDWVFKRAVEARSLEPVRTFYLWKLLSGTFHEGDAERIFGAAGLLAVHIDRENLIAFYHEIFCQSNFQALNAEVRLRHGLAVLCTALDWENDEKLLKLSQAFLVRLEVDMDSPAFVSSLVGCCRSVLATDGVLKASKLFLLIAESRACVIKLLPAVDDLFMAACKSGEFAICASLLKWKAARINAAELSDQLNSLISAAALAGAHEVLLDLLCKNSTSDFDSAFRPPFDTLIRRKFDMRKIRKTSRGVTSDHATFNDPFGRVVKRYISIESKVMLAIACSTDSSCSNHFQQLYRHVPPVRRIEIDEAAAVLSLQATWKATRNMETISAKLPTILAMLKGSGDRVLRKLDETLLVIYINGRQLDRAQAIVERLRKTNSLTARVIGSIAHLFARQGAWDSLHQLIKITRETPDLELDAEAITAWNGAFSAYCRHHGAEESYYFIADTTRWLGFRPNRATTDIALRCFVVQSRVDLLPRWMEYLRSLGIDAEVDIDMAVSLLRQYYTHYRPSHVLMMWFCRQLVQRSPQLQSQDLVDLLKQAIGYDMRHFSGQAKQWQLPHARSRLQALQDSGTEIPMPGYTTRGGQLRFHKSETSSRFSEPPAAVLPEKLTSPGGTNVIGAPDKPISSQAQASVDAAALTTEEALLPGIKDDGTPTWASTGEDVPSYSPQSYFQLFHRPDVTAHAEAAPGKETVATTNIDDALSTADTPNEALRSHQQQTQFRPFHGQVATGHAEAATREARVATVIKDDVSVVADSRRTALRSHSPRSHFQSFHEHRASDHAEATSREETKVTAAAATTAEVSSTADLATKPLQSDSRQTKFRPFHEKVPTAGPDSCDSTHLEGSHQYQDDVLEVPKFEQLREKYRGDEATENPVPVSDRRARKALEGEMIMSLSLGNYQDVVRLYHESLDAANVPASPMVLEIAIEASLRGAGDDTAAKAVMNRARKAGMNVSCAAGPLLLHQLRFTDMSDTKELRRLSCAVSEYYRMNELNGWEVQHHVGVAAADIMIKGGWPKHALTVLSAIYTSDWGKQREYDIVAMTVFLKGYIALRSLEGIRWVVQTVLERDIPMSKKFMQQLRRPVKRFKMLMGEFAAQSAKDMLAGWAERCHQRWLEQMHETRKIGWRLVRAINYERGWYKENARQKDV